MEERICALCGEELPEEDEGVVLKDGRLVCENCSDTCCGCCDECGEYVEEDELTYWGDDMRLCPDCFEQYFPPFDKKKNDDETIDAYEAMKKRLVGKLTEIDGPSVIHIETEMDEESYRRSIDVSIDENGRICDITRLSVKRCRSIWATGEDWLDIPVDPEDYDEDGFAEFLIRNDIDIVEEDE